MKTKKKSLVSDGKGQMAKQLAEEESSWTIHRTTAVAILFIAVFIMGMMTAFFLCASSIHSKTTQEPPPPPQQECPSIQELCAVCESSSKNPRQGQEEEEEFHVRETTSCTSVVRDPTTSSIFRGCWSWCPRNNWTSGAFWNPPRNSSSSTSSSLSVSSDKDSGGSSYYRCSKNDTWGALFVEILQVVWRLGALLMSVAIGYTSHYDMKSLGPSWRMFYRAMSCSLLSFGITPVLSILPTTATLMVGIASCLFDYAMVVLYHTSWWIEHYKIPSGVSFLLRFNALAGAMVLAFYSLRYSRDWLQLLLALTVFATLAVYGSTLFLEEESLPFRLCHNVEYDHGGIGGSGGEKEEEEVEKVAGVCYPPQ